jgi:hypothetical protein
MNGIFEDLGTSGSLNHDIKALYVRKEEKGDT